MSSNGRCTRNDQLTHHLLVNIDISATFEIQIQTQLIKLIKHLRMK